MQHPLSNDIKAFHKHLGEHCIIKTPWFCYFVKLSISSIIFHAIFMNYSWCLFYPLSLYSYILQLYISPSFNSLIMTYHKPWYVCLLYPWELHVILVLSGSLSVIHRLLFWKCRPCSTILHIHVIIIEMAPRTGEVNRSTVMIRKSGLW